MAAKTTPWWQRVIVGAFRGIRAGVAALLKPGKTTDRPTALVQEPLKPGKIADSSTALIQEQKKNQGKEELSKDSPQVNSNPQHETEPVVNPPAEIAEEFPVIEPEAATEPDAAPEPPAVESPEAAELAEQVETLPESPADLLAEAMLGDETAEPASEPANEPQQESSAPQDQTPEAASESAPIKTPQEEIPEPASEQAADPEAPELEVVEGASEPEEEAPADEPLVAHPEEAEAESVEGLAAPQTDHEPSGDQTVLPGHAIEETIVTPEIEIEATAQQPDLEAACDVLLEEESGEVSPAEEAITVEEASVEEAQPSEEPIAESPAYEAAAAQPAESQPAPAAVQPETESPVVAATIEPEQPAAPQVTAKPAPAPPQAVKREQGPDTSPVNVLVSQVYEGPFDLLLDLIRKQDIDIYDIPIAKITAQFLAYVNQLKASDVDVAGEFIYTASLLIHIKSKMLLPREPSGLGDEPEDPRRELVERLLEHERFKNAAQMLQQKQMLEAATWTNPGMREFRDDAGAEPEIAADTVDLVRIFREILDRARNRPVLNLEEDSVTVGQMIQFLGRRLTMEDKPLALRRLLAHTKSERALIAMFLALLELVRLQAILLRQDQHFSEIFIKKSSGFDAVINEGMARDDWQ